MREWIRDHIGRKEETTKPSGNLNVYQIEWEGEVYEMGGYGTEQEFRDWFENYASKAPACSSCEELIFPGQEVGRNGNALMHSRPGCSPTGGLFVGYMGEDGQIIPHFENGESMIERTLRTGSIQIYSGK